jgi:hypothetical protein
MPVTDLHATSGKHPACGEDTVSVEWEYGGKRKALWVSARNGKCHFQGCPAKKPKPPDDPLGGYLMDFFSMKKAAAQARARRVPKKAADGRELTLEERIRLFNQMYEKQVTL